MRVKKADKQKANKKTKGKGKKPHRFQPGQSGNPRGRPKLGDTSLDVLLAAVKRTERKLDKSLLDYYIERAFVSDAILISVMKKLHPDLKAVEVIGGLVHGSISDEEAKKIQDELKRRFK